MHVVVVNLKSDREHALRGVLYDVRGPWLTLRNVEIMEHGAPVGTIPGEAVVHRDNVAFFEVPPE